MAEESTKVHCLDVNDDRYLEVLKRLTPYTENGDDIVTKASRDVLIQCIKTDVRVHTVFFPHEVPHPLQERIDFR